MALLTGVFGAALLAALARAEKRQGLPERIGAADILLIGGATQKLARLVATDTVTSFLRAPFTRFKESSGAGEVMEEARGTGMQLALGELLACPFCLAQWIAAGFTVGLVTAPRAPRVVAAIYAAETVSDFLQLAYGGAESRV
jgi:hypothetical protein